MFDTDRRCLRSIVEPAVIFFREIMNYTGITPAGSKVTGRLEVEYGISYIVQVDETGNETWYMVHTSSVRKEN